MTFAVTVLSEGPETTTAIEVAAHTSSIDGAHDEAQRFRKKYTGRVGAQVSIRAAAEDGALIARWRWSEGEVSERGKRLEGWVLTSQGIA